MSIGSLGLCKKFDQLAAKVTEVKDLAPRFESQTARSNALEQELKTISDRNLRLQERVDRLESNMVSMQNALLEIRRAQKGQNTGGPALVNRDASGPELAHSPSVKRRPTRTSSERRLDAPGLDLDGALAGEYG